MFKKILLSLASIAVLVFTAVPAVHAIETQFVYVGDLNISETEYQAGDEITGSFTLRNAAAFLLGIKWFCERLLLLLLLLKKMFVLDIRHVVANSIHPYYRPLQSFRDHIKKSCRTTSKKRKK